MPTIQDKWNPKIKLVRAFAILFVIAFHFIEGPDYWGIFGVNLFFCTSGYLISGMLIRDKTINKKINLKSFVQKRVRRLVSASSVLIILVLILNYTDILNGYMKDYLISGTAYFFYVGNLAGLLPHSHHTTALALGHLWTLSAEMQFYFVWALFFINTLDLLRKKSQLVFVIFLILIGIPANRRHFLFTLPNSLSSLFSIWRPCSIGRRKNCCICSFDFSSPVQLFIYRKKFLVSSK